MMMLITIAMTRMTMQFSEVLSHIPKQTKLDETDFKKLCQRLNLEVTN